jgi:hypothetical protein
MKEENKKIIGYRLIKPEYLVPVRRILICDPIHDKAPIGNIATNHDINLLKKAGVLELWFQPVFEDIIELPTINKYEGVIDGDFIVYGCAKFHPSFFKNLYNVNLSNSTGNKKIKFIKLDSDVEITIEEVEQIVKYLNK